MLEITVESGHPDNICIVVLRGMGVLPHTLMLRDRLLEAFQAADQVALRMTELSSADLSFLQILCAGHRYGVERNKHLCFDPPSGNEWFDRLIDQAGFRRGKGCRPESTHNCLWLCRTGEIHG